MLRFQWLLEKRVLLEVEHTKTKVQSGVEVPSELVEFIFAQGLASDSRARLVVDRPLVLAAGERALGHFGRHCTDCLSICPSLTKLKGLGKLRDGERKAAP